jgi:cell division inhibitor SepF
MGVMDKFLQYMKINDDDEYLDEDYLDDEEVIEKPIAKKIVSVKEPEEEEVAERPVNIRKVPQNTRALQTRQNAAKKVSTGMEVCVIKPTSIEDAREITETLLQNRTVVLNLEGLDVDIAQRIIDFTSGSCFAIDGNLQKISHYIFIITPASVDVSGDFQNLFGGAFSSPLGNEM